MAENSGIQFEIYKSMNLTSVSDNFFMSHNKTPIKILSRVLVLFVISFVFSSCSDYLKGKPFKANYIEIKSDGKLACLDNVSGDMQKFLDSEGTDTQIDNTVSCINATLTELQTRVQGRAEASSFTADEVYEILATFASDSNISQATAKNMLALKAALLGGDENKISKAEIDLLKNYLILVKAEAKNLKPYIKLFYFETTEKAYTKEFIKEGLDQLNISLRNLYKASQLANSSYSFESFKNLIVNILNLTDDKKSMAEIASRMNSFLNGDQAVLNETDRLAYIDSWTEALRLYALYTNGYVKFEISTSAVLNETIFFIENIISLVENSLQYKKTQSISTQTIDGLISAVTNSNFLTDKISSYTAAMFYRTVIVRVLEAGANGDVAGFAGIKSFHLKNLKREIGIYKVYSKMLERVAGEELFASRGISSAPLREIQQALEALNIADEQEILSKYDATLQAQIVSNVNDLRSEFLESNPVIYRNKKIAVATNQNIWEQKWKDLARGLYVKMLARLLMQGWGQIYPLENIRTNYLSEVAMYNWYSEFKYFGIELKIFDPRTFNSGSAGFKIGNLFTRSGNGDNQLSFKETAENLGIMISGNGPAYQEISDDMVIARCNLAELDVFDKHWNNETCFYQVLRANYKFYFSNMPHLIAYLDTLNEDQFKHYFEDAVNVVRVDNRNTGSKVETAEITSMNSLLHFIEEIYVTHDTNANWQISEAEIRQAYPKFSNIATEFAYQNSRAQIEEFTSWKGTVAGYGCFSEQDLIRESFIFLIYNGRTPTQSDFNSFPCFSGKALMNFSGEVDRKTMVNTFKALKTVIGN